MRTFCLNRKCTTSIGMISRAWTKRSPRAPKPCAARCCLCANCLPGGPNWRRPRACPCIRKEGWHYENLSIDAHTHCHVGVRVGTLQSGPVRFLLPYRSGACAHLLREIRHASVTAFSGAGVLVYPEFRRAAREKE